MTDQLLLLCNCRESLQAHDLVPIECTFHHMATKVWCLSKTIRSKRRCSTMCPQTSSLYGNARTPSFRPFYTITTNSKRTLTKLISLTRPRPINPASGMKVISLGLSDDEIKCTVRSHLPVSLTSHLSFCLVTHHQLAQNQSSLVIWLSRDRQQTT